MRCKADTGGKFVQVIFDALNYVGDDSEKALEYGLMWLDDGKHFFSNSIILSTKLNIKINSLYKKFRMSQFINIHYNRNRIYHEFILKRRKLWKVKYHKSGLFYRGSTTNFCNNFFPSNIFKANYCICDGSIENMWNTLLRDSDDPYITKNSFINRIVKSYYDNISKIGYYLYFNVFGCKTIINKDDFTMFCKTYGLPQTSKSIFDFLADQNIKSKNLDDSIDKLYVNERFVVEPLEGKLIFKVTTGLSIYYIGILNDSFVLCHSFYKFSFFQIFKDIIEEISRIESLKSLTSSETHELYDNIYDEYVHDINDTSNELDNDQFYVYNDIFDMG